MKKALFTVFPYLKYILFIQMAVGGCCNLYFYGAAEYIDRISFIVVYFVFCVAFQLLMNRNRELREPGIGNVSVNCIIIEMYFVALFSQRHLGVCIAILSVLLLLQVLIFRTVVAGNEVPRSSKAMMKRCRDRAQRIICVLAAAVLIVPSCVGIYEEYRQVSLTPEEWAVFVKLNTKNDGDTEETLFEKYEDTVREMSKWESLDNESKIELIYKIGIMELENLGIGEDVGITMEADKTDEHTLGYYLNTEKHIVINVGHICSDDLSENISTVAHEVFHAYQHYVVSSVDFESEFVRTSYYYEDARRWKENMENYISAESDFEGYRSQPLEADASEYASQRAEEYAVAISGGVG